MPVGPWAVPSGCGPACTAPHLCVCPLHKHTQPPLNSPIAQAPQLPLPLSVLFLCYAPGTHPPGPPILHKPLCLTSLSSRISQLSTCPACLSGKGLCGLLPKPLTPFPSLGGKAAQAAPSPHLGEGTRRRKHCRFFSLRLLDFAPKCRVCSCLHFFFCFLSENNHETIISSHCLFPILFG